MKANVLEVFRRSVMIKFMIRFIVLSFFLYRNRMIEELFIIITILIVILEWVLLVLNREELNFMDAYS